MMKGNLRRSRQPRARAFNHPGTALHAIDVHGRISPDQFSYKSPIAFAKRQHMLGVVQPMHEIEPATLQRSTEGSIFQPPKLLGKAVEIGWRVRQGSE